MKLIRGDALNELRKMADSSVHACITDPPYFIDRMGQDWDSGKLKEADKSAVVGGLPSGMDFDPRQGPAFQTFIREISSEVIRVLKPGGFYIAFSQARLYHHLAMAVESCGFEIRDMLGWCYEGQAKAFSHDHFVRKNRHLSEQEKHQIIASMNGRKTPQLKPQIEPMVLAQKPKIGTFVDNWIEHRVGLVDTSQSLDGKFPGQLMPVRKPTVSQKGQGNTHPSVKPVPLIEHLVKLFTVEGQIVLDPFMGSGSHGVAALLSNRSFTGIEREPSYFSIAEDRIDEALWQRLRGAFPRKRKFKEYQFPEFKEAA